MFKALTVVLLAVALMVTLKDGRALHDTGLIATCTAVSTPAGQAGYWQACRPGRLEGRPNLKRKSCEPIGLAEGVEYWRCPSPIDSASAG